MEGAWLHEPGVREHLGDAISYLAPMVVGQPPVAVCEQLQEEIDRRGIQVPPEVVGDIADRLATGKSVDLNAQ
jgi:hypothetical protein